MKNNTMMPRKILGGEQRQSLPVNILPMVACALRKIKNKSRDQSLLKIDLFLHFSNVLMPLTGETSVCRGVWMC